MADSTPTNAFELSVSELSAALKRTVEDRFGLVRVRGEISNFRGPHSSGHCYFVLKDQTARLDAVIWKGAYLRLKHRPQEGLEVIATGRITTYPGKSSYQIVIDALEPAGVGALLAQLEARRKALLAEGLFDAARKRPLPFLPRVVGVITSPTGAVIRDILHRLADRFPRHVVLWPVRVQGETAAEEVAAAIAGFNALEEGGSPPRPDVLIVARGGGSLEDLWAFNEEIVVRAAAASAIALVSAIGHETDTTLLDHVADLRAPTPTGAAEKSVPVRADLLAQLAEWARRFESAERRSRDRRAGDLRTLARVLARPEEGLAAPRQRADAASLALARAATDLVARRRARVAAASVPLARHSPHAELARARGLLNQASARFDDFVRARATRRREALARLDDHLRRALGFRLARARDEAGADRLRLHALGARLAPALARLVRQRADRLKGRADLLASLGYRNVLARGFALVRDETGRPVRAAAAVAPGDRLRLEFVDGVIGATADGASARRPARRPGGAQGDLF